MYEESSKMYEEIRAELLVHKFKVAVNVYQRYFE
jgi:hypothetical protein